MALLVSPFAARAEVPLFTANEMRAARMKDQLRAVQTEFKDGTPPALRHSRAVAAAFKDAEEWAPDAETYYGRKNGLVERAAALEAQLEAAVVRNTPERAGEVARSLDGIDKKARVLRSDHEFYVGLPRLAAGPQRKAAQAAMRLLGQTGDYVVALAFFLDKTPQRAPFAPLAPGAMYIRHR